MDRITLEKKEVLQFGLTTAMTLSVIKKTAEKQDRLSRERIIEVSTSFGLRKDQVEESISVLQDQGHLVKDNDDLKYVMKALTQHVELSETTGRRLRQFGLTASEVRSHKEAYLRTVSDRQDEAGFLQYVIQQTRNEFSQRQESWQPADLVIQQLKKQGITNDFLENGLLLFRERYSPQKGGGDIEKNFIRFIRTSWERQKVFLPTAWLPTTTINLALIEYGIAQKEIMRQIIEFRLWATEIGKRSSDWDAEFEKYVLNNQIVSKQLLPRPISVDTI